MHKSHVKLPTDELPNLGVDICWLIGYFLFPAPSHRYYIALSKSTINRPAVTVSQEQNRHVLIQWSKTDRTKELELNENATNAWQFGRNIIILWLKNYSVHEFPAAQTVHEGSGMLGPCRFTWATAFAVICCNNMPQMNLLAVLRPGISAEIMRWCYSQTHCFIQREQCAVVHHLCEKVKQVFSWLFFQGCRFEWIELISLRQISHLDYLIWLIWVN